MLLAVESGGNEDTLLLVTKRTTRSQNACVEALRVAGGGRAPLSEGWSSDLCGRRSHPPAIVTEQKIKINTCLLASGGF